MPALSSTPQCSVSVLRLRWFGFVGQLAFVLTTSAPAAAHHPGHSSTVSEGIRSLNNLSHAGGNANNRIAVIHDATRTTTGTDRATTLRALFIAEIAPHPWFSFGAEAPLRGIVEDDEPPAIGYGDTRLFVRLTPHGDKLVHRVLTVGLAASLPTRSTTRSSEPERPWSLSPHVLFTRSYERAFWSVIGQPTVETRSAGTALDISAAGQLGYRFFDVLSPSIGATVDVRTASWCDGSFCSDGRVGEVDRAVGATRVYLLGGLGYQITSRGTLLAGVQVPVTTARDFDIGVNLGVQFLF
jgi:hypothetical protein